MLSTDSELRYRPRTSFELEPARVLSLRCARLADGRSDSTVLTLTAEQGYGQVP